MDGEKQYCNWCGNEIRVMCQRNTGFCCQLCERAWKKREATNLASIKGLGLLPEEKKHKKRR